MSYIQEFEKKYLKDREVNFGPGDTIVVHQRIKEGDKERIQIFQGVVIGRRGGGTGASFTVRKISSGVSVEKVFPLHSPNITKIDKIRTGIVRRAKLYYLRDRYGKKARIAEKRKDKK